MSSPLRKRSNSLARRLLEATNALASQGAELLAAVRDVATEAEFAAHVERVELFSGRNTVTADWREDAKEHAANPSGVLSARHIKVGDRLKDAPWFFVSSVKEEDGVVVVQAGPWSHRFEPHAPVAVERKAEA